MLRAFLCACWVGLLAANCFSASPPAPLATLPLQFRHNRAHVMGRIDGRDFNFLIDTGCGVTTLHPELVDELLAKPETSLKKGRGLRMVGIAGEEQADTYRGVSIGLGGLDYRPRYIASLPSERREARRRRDGVLGEGFFKDFVVEIDPQAKLLRLYAPTNFAYAGGGEVVPLSFRGDTPVVEASLVMGNGKALKREFEVDTGCDSGLCLGGDFVKAEKLLEALETRSSEKFGIGGAVETRDATIPALRLGGLEIGKPQADFFSEGSPVDAPAVGHIGMGVFHRYRTIFDYARKRMILEKLETTSARGP